jgi:hypothetical protein
MSPQALWSRLSFHQEAQAGVASSTSSTVRQERRRLISSASSRRFRPWIAYIGVVTAPEPGRWPSLTSSR